MESRAYYRTQMVQTKSELFQTCYNDAMDMFNKLQSLEYDREHIKKYRIIDLMKALHKCRTIIDMMESDVNNEIELLYRAPGAQ